MSTNTTSKAGREGCGYGGPHGGWVDGWQTTVAKSLFDYLFTVEGIVSPWADNPCLYFYFSQNIHLVIWEANPARIFKLKNMYFYFQLTILSILVFKFIQLFLAHFDCIGIIIGSVFLALDFM